MIGQTISHYRVTAELGAGGMGIVYRAEDLRLGRQAAIKFLPDAAADHPQALQRFYREARAASALNHRHICTIYEVDEHDGRPFIVMEALEGETLQKRLVTTRFSLESLVDVMVQVAEGLGAAHAKGIVHRDIKPSNIFLTDSGDVKILDFGLAKLGAVDTAADSSGPTTTSPGGLLTGEGETLGTIAFMSPEQVRGDELDARSDIFSCGVVMYEMATGTLPFHGPTAGLVFDGILNRRPPAASTLNAAMPAELDRVLDKALEKDRELRYQSARDLRADLARLPDYLIFQGRFSPDGRWIVFNAQSLKSVGTSVLGVIPAAGGHKWTPLTETSLWADKPRWSPDGRTIYFISNRNSAFFDVWGLEFDPARGASVGDEFRVTRNETPGRTVAGAGASELGVSSTRLAVPIVEAKGSIWVLDRIAR